MAYRRRSGRHIQQQQQAAPPQQPPAYADTGIQMSRQLSPLIQHAPVQSYIRRLLRYGIATTVPIATYYVGKYSNPIKSTIKDIANYGKRMTINALAAIKNTPYKEEAVNATQPTPTPSPTATPIPRPTPDKQHPRTSLQIYNQL